jgi:1-deoxy-D-xylulose-5-phosphate synthase
VAEALAARAVVTPLLHLGLPDRFVDHGDQGQLLASVGLDRAGIVAAVRARLEKVENGTHVKIL